MAGLLRRLEKALRLLRDGKEPSRPPVITEGRGIVVMEAAPEREWYFDVRWGEVGCGMNGTQRMTVFRGGEN
jgi:hypothetical protein